MPISDFALSVYYSIRLNFEKALKYAKDDPYSLRFLYEIKGYARVSQKVKGVSICNL